MAFVTECPFCKKQAKVPDRALGGSALCPRCASSFTIAPRGERRSPATGAEAAPLAQSALGTAIAAADTAIGDHRQAIPPNRADRAGARLAARVRPESLIGAAALLTAGAAMLCAAIPAGCSLVQPLSGLGLLAGLGGLVLARRSTPPRGLVALAGSVAAGVVLCVSVLFPAALGPTYHRSRQTVGPTSMAMRAIPLAEAGEVAEIADGVDATRFALQQGELRVQVVQVTTGVLPARPGANAKPGQPRLLLIRLRTVEVRTARPARSAQMSETLRNGANRPTLIDPAGTTYPLEGAADLEAAEAKQGVPFPAAVEDVVLGFAMPPGGWDLLRLDLPGAAWGGSGTFRFKLPAAMLAPDGPAGMRRDSPSGG